MAWVSLGGRASQVFCSIVSPGIRLSRGDCVGCWQEGQGKGCGGRWVRAKSSDAWSTQLENVPPGRRPNGSLSYFVWDSAYAGRLCGLLAGEARKGCGGRWVRAKSSDAWFTQLENVPPGRRPNGSLSYFVWDSAFAGRLCGLLAGEARKGCGGRWVRAKSSDAWFTQLENVPPGRRPNGSS